jgi:hypothetical protein
MKAVGRTATTFWRGILFILFFGPLPQTISTRSSNWVHRRTGAGGPLKLSDDIAFLGGSGRRHRRESSMTGTDVFSRKRTDVQIHEHVSPLNGSKTFVNFYEISGTEIRTRD